MLDSNREVAPIGIISPPIAWGEEAWVSHKSLLGLKGSLTGQIGAELVEGSRHASAAGLKVPPRKQVGANRHALKAALKVPPKIQDGGASQMPNAWLGLPPNGQLFKNPIGDILHELEVESKKPLKQVGATSHWSEVVPKLPIVQRNDCGVTISSHRLDTGLKKWLAGQVGVESENDSWATSGTKIRIENASKGITLFNYQSMI